MDNYFHYYDENEWVPLSLCIISEYWGKLGIQDTLNRDGHPTNLNKFTSCFETLFAASIIYSRTKHVYIIKKIDWYSKKENDWRSSSITLLHKKRRFNSPTRTQEDEAILRLWNNKNADPLTLRTSATLSRKATFTILCLFKSCVRLKMGVTENKLRTNIAFHPPRYRYCTKNEVYTNKARGLSDPAVEE